ncbi:winged helix-turn-helix domain-containing protein [Microbacterium sp. cx-59]|uniref:winged helix-turn-helix domain-containing protein n=1 Tax=Microbacterium sp. cx-59 TaxID=2891207 RepID=UPI001E6038DD|nr:crosslink repair DNA glycosylase YcaQ family protein [Microbacterium sp. cx-59]MCC4906792.1 winged helix DNA-binding domain-containing protein [Microbacterium sp. cx-59]
MATLQIDSVNVFARSHYMPLFSRVGAYDTASLDRLLFARRAPYTEYWAHQAAFVAAEDRPLFGFRMQANRERQERSNYFGVDDRTVEWVRSELAARGPLRPAEIEDDAVRAPRGPWWDWSGVKSALEYLWFAGEVAIAGRRGFERVYGLAEHVLPAEVVGRSVPRGDAIRELVARAARAYGVATLADLDDYWRIRDQRAVRVAVHDLEDAGVLQPVRVEGWTRGERPLAAWLHRNAAVPRRIDAATVLTPFDPMVWFRDRAERLFDFSYRIEIYTPAAKRRFGYYSLPILLGDGMAGRIDLKADRAAATLRVQSAWWEPSRPADAAASAAEVLRAAAAWQGLESITVARWGDAADEIAGALGAERHESRPEPVELAQEEPG